MSGAGSGSGDLRTCRTAKSPSTSMSSGCWLVRKGFLLLAFVCCRFCLFLFSVAAGVLAPPGSVRLSECRQEVLKLGFGLVCSVDCSIPVVSRLVWWKGENWLWQPVWLHRCCDYRGCSCRRWLRCPFAFQTCKCFSCHEAA